MGSRGIKEGLLRQETKCSETSPSYRNRRHTGDGKVDRSVAVTSEISPHDFFFQVSFLFVNVYLLSVGELESSRNILF